MDDAESKADAADAATTAGAGAGVGVSIDTPVADDGLDVSPSQARLTPLQSVCVKALDADGLPSYEHAAKPAFLVVAAALLRVLSDTSGEGELAMAAARLPSASWWCARAAVAQQRTLTDGKPAASLWRLVTTSVRRAAAAFASPEVGLVEENPAREEAPTELEVGEDGSIAVPEARRGGMPQACDAKPTGKQEPLLQSERLRSALLVEWALAQRMFGKDDAASESLMAAKAASGMRALLTGARGKKTK